MNKTNRIIGGLFGVFWGWTSVSCASMSADLPQTKMYAGIPYLSGGVGVDERAALQRQSKEDNVHLIFAAVDGVYLSDVNVTITDSKGQEVLKAVSEGPWFFTKLPMGKYIVTADMKGRALHRTVQAPKTGQTQVLFSWDDSILRTSVHPLAKR